MFTRPAKQHGGQFILRIDNTDQARHEGIEDAIIKALRRQGLDWDEGPDVGGNYGPYRQSELFDIYREHVEILLAKGMLSDAFSPLKNYRVYGQPIRRRAERELFTVPTRETHGS